MLSLTLICAAGVIACLLGRRSLLHGLAWVLGVGYFYGILRANLLQSWAHFLFDGAVLGLYAAQLFRQGSTPESPERRAVWQWLLALTCWAGITFLFFFQDAVVQIVGLRGSVFLLPFALFGVRLDGRAASRLAMTLAALNVAALGFALAEYFLGVPRFYPHSAVTDLIYRSADVASHATFRIPGTFVNPHAYGGTMAATLPLIVGAWAAGAESRSSRALLVAGIGSAVLGIFLCAARTPAVVLFVLVAVTTLSGYFGRASRVGWLTILLMVGWVVSSQERLQRFTTLRDTDMVIERVAGSVNLRFLELAAEYPLGNGLGGGGTSVPYFLQRRLQRPVSMENEYARILLEQGIPGLTLWLGFLAWALLRHRPRRADPWYLGRRLGWWVALMSFAVGLTGTGLFTSIPHSALLMLTLGWVIAAPRRAVAAVPDRRAIRSAAFTHVGRSHA